MFEQWVKAWTCGQERGRDARRWPFGAAIALCAITLQAQAADDFVVGQSLPLTGVATSVGIPLAAGTQAVIDAVNASGGIRGTKIKLITLDDNFVPARSTT